MDDKYTKTEAIEQKNYKCSNCNIELNKEAQFCPSCGFPEKGTDLEKSKFHAHAVLNKNKYFDADKKVKEARNTLYILAGIIFVFSLYETVYKTEDATLFTINFIISFSFMILGYWSIKKPLAALLSALFLYITLIVSNGIFDPTILYNGLVAKIFIISYLGRGVYSANAYQKELHKNENTQ